MPLAKRYSTIPTMESHMKTLALSLALAAIVGGCTVVPIGRPVVIGPPVVLAGPPVVYVPAPAVVVAPPRPAYGYGVRSRWQRGYRY